MQVEILQNIGVQGQIFTSRHLLRFYSMDSKVFETKQQSCFDLLSPLSLSAEDRPVWKCERTTLASALCLEVCRRCLESYFILDNKQ